MSNDTPEVTAIEDLMREHGVLNRILLIYEEIIRRLQNDLHVPNKIIHGVASIIRKFVEDYHEKTEEKYVFPLLVSKNKDIKLIDELINQHNLGRNLTDNILRLTSNEISNKNELIKNIYNFVKMYRYHETREDTEVFQDFRKSLTEKEYRELGEKFEEDEHKVLGNDGFSNTLKLVESIEKYLEIYDLSKITKEIKMNIAQ